jgi:ribosomal protein L16/L10AE
LGSGKTRNSYSEISAIPEEIARAALSLAAYKLPIKTKFIIKDNID